MKRLSKYLPLILFSLCISFYSIGQKDSAKNKIYLWLSAGECLTYSDNFKELIGFRMAANSSINQKYFITLHFQRTSILLDGFMSQPTPNVITDLTNGSLLLGLGKYKYKSLAFIASSGISYGKANYRGELLESKINGGSITYYIYYFEEDSYRYIGLPVNFKILLTSPYIGLSLDLYANFHKHSDYGLTLGINFGKIRDKIVKHEN